MRKPIKKITGVIMAVSMVMACTMPSVQGSSAETAQTGQCRDLSASQVIQEMGTGWNLGNTFDAMEFEHFVPGETTWQSDVTTQDLITAVHDMGFNTLRIPASWGSMIHEDYSIDEAWIGRIKEVIDYAVSQDMYVVLNIHHDGANDQEGWLNIREKDTSGNWNIKSGASLDKLFKDFEGTWKTIASYFDSYDEHLLFESMNEVGGSGGSDNGLLEEVDIINRLNQVFVDTVRASGGNNGMRWLVVPCRYTTIKMATDDQYQFKMPEDTYKENRIMLSVHDYDAYSFTRYGKPFQALSQKFVQKGIPVFLGEYGFQKRHDEARRTYFYECVNRFAKNYGIIPVAWDNNGVEGSGELYGLINRKTCEPFSKAVICGIMRGFYGDGRPDSIQRDEEYKAPPELVPAANFTLSESQVEMSPGSMKRILVADTEPQENNDVILWKTSDKNVATVSGGRIRARGTGTTVVTAYSQNGSITKEVQVTVTENAAQDTDNVQLYDTPVYPDENYDQYAVPVHTILDKGTVTISDGGRYKIIDDDINNLRAAYIGPEDKSTDKIVIPGTIISDTYVYMVTSIDAKACKGLKNLSSVVIGNNIRKIGNEAFAGDKSLGKITVKTTKLSSVGRDALKGVKNAVIKVPKTKKAKYKKLFAGKGQAKSVTVK